MQAQARICPECKDDHGEGVTCRESELGQEVVKLRTENERVKADRNRIGVQIRNEESKKYTDFIAELEERNLSLAESLRKAHAENARLQRLVNAKHAVAQAEQAIDDESWRYSDPTGQDADDPVMDQKYSDLVSARDELAMEEDPIAEAERRYFAAAAGYLP